MPIRECANAELILLSGSCRVFFDDHGLTRDPGNLGCQSCSRLKAKSMSDDNAPQGRTFLARKHSRVGVGERLTKELCAHWIGKGSGLNSILARGDLRTV